MIDMKGASEMKQHPLSAPLMNRLIAVLLLLLISVCPALADTLTTNGGVTLDTADLPYCAGADEPPWFITSPTFPRKAWSGCTKRWAWICPAKWA